MLTNEQKLEAVLFWKGEPIGKKTLCKMLGVDAPTLAETAEALRRSLANRGVTLIETVDEFSMATSREASSLIETLVKDELSKDIGKAGLETLALVLYWGPISRRDIDYIRGVNSTFILRNLLIRGLVERVTSEKDQRGFLYRPTTSLLSHLGVGNITELPEFETVSAMLTTLTESSTNESGSTHPSETPLS